ncbi:MAG: hypothetical protein KBC66_04425 [Kiritimatiellae bacterium]|jgi:hypothetical protein|nr:hypothetical protein [Kiritimatiellia bacterium]NLD89689.1 hypothetical protein [Lentisphaerota bacterium]HOU21266.1 hypothetical protein [Kiritimatiellia bacterium]HPC19275.1 hypothetical protein [Kiritimatiellia bacterium]
MKKLIAGLMVGLMVLAVTAPAADAAAKGAGRGGFVGFIAGCCFGIRSGSAFNDGKEIHFREWCRLIPYVNIVFAIWDGVDGAKGTTTADLASQYGATYY